MERIHIYHTNDLHSHFENWPRIQEFLLEQREYNRQKNEEVLIFDIGDALDRVHPLTEATDGKANIAALNQIHYDGATIGNNEGVGNSKKQLNQLYSEANFPVLLANLIDKETNLKPEWAELFKIYQTKSGHRIGVFGLTAPFPTSYEPNGWHVIEPDDCIPELLEILIPMVDSIFLLSHLGIEEDRKIANMYPMINLIMGSHTHHLLPTGEKNRETFVTAAGKFGQHIGHITLELAAGKIQHEEAEVIATCSLPPTANEAKLISDYEEQGHSQLKEQQIAYLPNAFPISWKGSSPLVKLGLKAIKDYAQTEVAIVNAGLFMEPLQKGIVSKNDLHQILPHPMRVLTCTLDGENLERLILEMEKNRNYLRYFPIKGLGFRGKLFGEICYDGISYDNESQTVYWQGAKLEPQKEYTLATVDHFLYVPFFPTIEIKGSNQVLFPFFIRDVLGQYLKRNYPIA
ncbi:multifunctional 2',3'-cyclic-nucleotide 2'-phosphodiesterase/5'-nucleotidase/3'-nucleotidase [Carnobacterium divergens]|uniref:bifunctional metallophosphatase/5'-nucleotidase n=1 Tax=Carnobacterium divergens TaxID=2748 RepID=UPI000D4DAEA7|nr:bifunctional UDP-sugar hydrolase/5'-nucleotidase [Carnobacterium divergens]MCO6017155.1 bifunctional metallophosphatase/5'-nucleotidase [Carnobacterium divergens]TFI62318.1 multifunctional 2',3'-cyclic-nucleotide 2'-phosphodiesterase/5'-nucleotidase/3'-nucleotidase [Carnobacterium divergens]TFI89520.1 multifunctional 2',3'-cyclic-nucleotide 2'-phosphodiesterase/5'-nucleotidase/3'-nucleotidase [Carnobacterium divergens]TFJ04575.1 multifunctional 2',3'-cyclic-nucleotide 2'-phosphodiesterase/5'